MQVTPGRGADKLWRVQIPPCLALGTEFLLTKDVEISVFTGGWLGSWIREISRAAAVSPMYFLGTWTVGLDHAADRLVVKAYDGHILRNAQPVLL